MNVLKKIPVCVLLMSVNWVYAQERRVTEAQKEAAFNAYADYLDNAERVHNLGYLFYRCSDFTRDEAEAPTVQTTRNYGIVAVASKGNWLRSDHCSWTLSSQGIDWLPGERYIKKDGKYFHQIDPGPAEMIEKEWGAHTYLRFKKSPFAEPIASQVILGKGMGTWNYLDTLLEPTSLVWVNEDSSMLECYYLGNSNGFAYRFVYSKTQGGMITEYDAFLRKPLDRSDKPPMDVTSPDVFKKWFRVVRIRSDWEKIREHWVPSVVDFTENFAHGEFVDRVVRYSFDWRFGEDITEKDFDAMAMGEEADAYGYAVHPVIEDYRSKQEAIDNKVMQLWKRFQRNQEGRN